MDSTIQYLKDPCKDRQVPTVELPPNQPMEARTLFPYKGKASSTLLSYHIILHS